MPQTKLVHRTKAWPPKYSPGCIACRSRRVKCDRTEPVCLKCSVRGLQCQRQSSQSSRALQHTTAGRLKSNPSHWPTLHESAGTTRTFGYFLGYCVPMLTNGFAGEFWGRLVLQTAHVDAAILHSINSIALLLDDIPAMKPNWGPFPKFYPTKKSQLALVHYGKALKLFNNSKSFESTNFISLACCLLFVYIECLIGNIPHANIVLTSGLRLLCKGESDSMDLQTIRPFNDFLSTFLRLDAFFVQLRRFRHPTLHPEPLILPTLTIPFYFTNLSEASYYLSILINMCQRLPRVESMTSKYATDLGAYRKLFRDWDQAFYKLPAVHSDELQTSEKHNLYLCHIWKLDTQITLFGPQAGEPETGWDAHQKQFTELLHYAVEVETLGLENKTKGPDSFSLGGGLYHPLFRLVTRCRHPEVRRPAISLLSRYPHAEGPIHGPLYSKILYRIVSIEETGLRDVKTSSDIPETSRIIFVSLYMVDGGKSAEIMYSKRVGPDNRSRFTLQDKVSLEGMRN